MLDPGEFDPTLYWLHVVLGFSTVVFVILALASQKGSALHRRSGQLFSIGMRVAALTALVGFIGFVLTNPDLPEYLLVLGPVVGMLFLVMAWKDATFDFYSFGPFLLVPLCYFASLPRWLRNDKAAPVPA
ncbi:MAG: hypothetical protein AAF692_01295 [Pseudomonadota bacterium]